jgi:hypothetical protein
LQNLPIIVVQFERVGGEKSGFQETLRFRYFRSGVNDVIKLLFDLFFLTSYNSNKL